MTRHHSCRVSPFGHPRIHARLAAPRGISQPPTSFIGSQCQGIHHVPLTTYNKHFLSKPIFGKIAPTNKPPKREPICEMLATTIHESNTTPHHQSRATTTHPPNTRGNQHPRFPNQQGTEVNGLVVSKPNSVFSDPAPARSLDPRPATNICRAPEPHPLQAQPIQRIAQHTEPPQSAGGA